MHSIQTRNINRLTSCTYWMITFPERADRCREQLMFSSAIGWVLSVLYHSALESSSTEGFDIKMPQIITFTIYCNSETPCCLFVLFSSVSSYVQLWWPASPTRFGLVPHNLIMYCMRDHMHNLQWALHIPGPHVHRPLFLHSPSLRRTHLIAAPPSLYACIAGPLLRSFKTSPAVIISSSGNNSEHKGRLRWTQVHVKAAGLRSPTTLLSLDVIVSTGGRPRWFKARMGATRSPCPRSHSQRQPNLAARCDWKPARSPVWAKILQFS